MRARLTRERLFFLIALTAGTAGCAYLSLRGLGSASLWLDEAATVSIAGRGGALWHGIARDGGDMALYYLMLHAVIHVFGDGPLVIRLPSALAAIGCVPVTGVLGMRLFSARTGAIAALLAGVSVPLVSAGREARGYTGAVLLTALAFLALERYVRTGSRRSLAWWSLSAAAAIGFQLSAGLAVAAMVAAAIAARPSAWREVTIATGGVAALIAPLAALVMWRGDGQVFWIPPLSGSQITTVLRELFAGGTGYVWLVVAALVAVGVCTAFRSAPQGRWPYVAVGLWVGVPIAVLFLLSAVVHPAFVSRYLDVVVPGIALLAAWPLSLPRSGWVSGALACGLVALLVWPQRHAPGPLEDWRGATAYVIAGSRPGDAVIFYTAQVRAPFEYYWIAGGKPPELPVPVEPATPWSAVGTSPGYYVYDFSAPPAGIVDALPREYGRVWLVLSHAGSPTGPTAWIDARRAALEAGLAAAWTESSTHHFDGVTVELFTPR